MFLDQIEKRTRPIGTRLTLWFSLVFCLGLLLTQATSYYLLSASLVNKDQELIRSKWKEYADTLGMEGIGELAHKAEVESKMPGNLPFAIVLEEEGETIFSYFPPSMRKLTAVLLEMKHPESQRRKGWWEIFDSENKSSIELLSSPLGHHNLLTVGKSNHDRNESLQRYRRILLLTLAPVIILGFLAGLFFSKRALRPIRGLSQTARAIYRGDITARVSSTGTGDELDELGKLFNQMLGRIQILVEGMRDALDNVAHDLRTPMTRFRGLAEEGLSAGSIEVQREALLEGLESSEEILRLLNTLMDLSSAETGTLSLNRETFDLTEAVKEAVELYQFIAEEKKIQIQVVAPQHIHVNADKTRIAQAVANLLDNAVKYTALGGSVSVQATREGNRAILRITDTGVGISERELPRIWERLYRGDKSRSEKGMGLGLSIVRATIQAHLGEVRVESLEGKGSTFIVSLPTAIST